jgi:2-keto-4-pentenoate hydratase/2-oxohepta-3-ene-1,7-dioic acid hydratase in catechol pathway
LERAPRGLFDDRRKREAFGDALGNPESGVGFTSGKSAPGFLPVGDLFVVPRDVNAFSRNLVLQLSVNGVERQRSPVDLWIWDIDRILTEASRLRDRSWAFGGEVASLPFSADGTIPERTLVLTGTPGGTAFRGIYPSAYVRGGLAWLAGGWDRCRSAWQPCESR